MIKITYSTILANKKMQISKEKKQILQLKA